MVPLELFVAAAIASIGETAVTVVTCRLPDAAVPEAGRICVADVPETVDAVGAIARTPVDCDRVCAMAGADKTNVAAKVYIMVFIGRIP